MQDTIAAIATGNCISAIGIVRISGEEAISAAERLFRPYSGKRLSESRDRQLVYGRLFTCEGELLDICLCTISRAPGTYTGENTAEFQCHGSPVVLHSLLEELFKLGVRQARAGEFTKRAFLNGRMELTSAEAVADLIDSENLASAINAAGQLSGAIGTKMDAIYSSLTDICAHYHAVLDYPDEDIEDFEIKSYLSTISGAQAKLQALLKTYERGKSMNSGIPVAITGRPNAGKSSLLNALLGYNRAIVTNIPGTTRDTIEERVTIGRTAFRFIDTAGIRAADDEVERLGVERSMAAMKKAELNIVLIDGTGPLTGEDEQLILEAAASGGRVIIAVSKSDAPGYSVPNIAGEYTVVSLSSVEPGGTDALTNAILSLFPEPAVPAGEILTNPRQAQAMQTALDYLVQAEKAIEAGLTPDIILTEIEGAMDAIGELTGKTVREDVTNRIFQRFCVGK